MTLEEFFHQYPEVAVAFSGGVDSAWLLHQAARYARRCTAYFVNTAFQPAFEWEDADQTARQVGAELRVLELDILSAPEVTANPADRCYYCKKRLFTALARAAAEDGYHVLLDGTNASDDAADRPGMRALQELQVLSPLRLCGVTKAQVRRSAREAGLSVWDKPSYACLATRIPAGEAIRLEALRRVERGEAALMDMGFADFRLRLREGGLLQVTASQHALARARWEEIAQCLRGDFPQLKLDDTPRPSRED